MDTLGKKLKKLRKQKKWTLEEVAGKLGLRGHSTYSNWEYDRREPDLETIIRLAEIYEIDASYLMPNQNGKITEDLFGHEMLSTMKRLAEEREVKDKEQILREHDEWRKILEVEEFVKDIELSDEELLKKYLFQYDGKMISEEKIKKILSYIRFVAKEDD